MRSRTGERWRDWKSGSFGPASEQPFRRRSTDWIRLSIAAVVLAVLVADYGPPSGSALGLFQFFNGLPSDLTSFFTLLYRAGALWGVGIIAAAALIARRWRLAMQLAVAGSVAWFVARVLGATVVSGASLSKGLDVATRFGDQTPSFPLARLAVLVAVIATASPYLTRPIRRLGHVFIVLMALAAMYLGTSFPDGVLAGLVLGWGVAALVHLTFGSPGGRPTRAQVGATLAELGVDVETVELDPAQPQAATVMHARDDHGDLTVRVLGRDEVDAQLPARLWRLAVYKDGGPTLHLTRIEAVEHQAYTMLVAERAGVRVPSVTVAGKAGPGTALLAERTPDGARLAGSSDALPAHVLEDLWEQVARLREAGVAHGALNANHVVLTNDGPLIADFENASVAAPPERLAGDVAELLYSTSTMVGKDRAIELALNGIGRDGVVAALPMLQPPTLSRELRPHGRHKKKELGQQVTDLRDAAAKAAGVELPPLQQLYRIDTTQLLMAVGTLIAVFALLSQVGDPQTFWNTITSADWVPLAGALVISFLTNFATAVSLMGTIPISLPLARTAELQLSMSFSNLAVPAVGGLAAQIRFLQRQGADLASAVASGGLLANVGNITACLLLFVVAVILSPAKVDVGQIDTQSVVSGILIIVLIVLVVIGLITGIPKLRRTVMPPVTSALSTMREALRSPRRVAFLLGGNMVNALMYAAVMWLCLDAFGGHLDYWTVLSINIVVGTIASLVPIPGGGTAVGAVGMSGALTAVGVSTEIAVAAVLANQLVANFIPAVPGWFATNNLLHDKYL